MKPFIVGVGRAGCRIANLFFTEGSSKVKYTGVLIDTEKSELDFSKGYKIVIGERYLEGNGTGKDLELGREIMEGEKVGIVEKMDRVRGEPDCFFVISSIGGGTGGAVSLLLEEMKRSYVEPIYYAGILPSEEDLKEVIENCSMAFKDILKHSDAQFLIDNDLLKKGQRLRGRYNTINRKIYRYFNSLFEVGEVKSREDVGTNMVTTGDILNTLAGVSTIGIGRHELEGGGIGGILGHKEEGIDKPELIVSLTEEAVEDLLVEFDIEDAQKALVVVSGPKRYLDFLGSIPARLWVEKKTGGEVRGGDMPSRDKKNLQVMLVFSGIKKSERVKQLYRLGKTAKDEGAAPHKIAGIFEKLRDLNSRISKVGKEVEDICDEIGGMLGGEPNGEE
ncbi:MAG: hypothetical protein ACE5PM_03635 [Candidatus Hydrothermarchaeales archaeon]